MFVLVSYANPVPQESCGSALGRPKYWWLVQVKSSGLRYNSLCSPPLYGGVRDPVGSLSIAQAVPKNQSRPRHIYPFRNRNRFTVRICQHLTQPPNWKTTTCRLSATAYSMYSQPPSILEAVPPFATWGCAMSSRQGPAYHVKNGDSLVKWHQFHLTDVHFILPFSTAALRHWKPACTEDIEWCLWNMETGTAG